ncbi:MAG TPA: 50S ribosomal protein L21 [Candidatus Woesebacteria bacterium]|jgi:large subunit ribosomal protein L21|nr:50S ribosomal protein L21 [Candidatus Shapirobacteria bacterium]HOR01693.1 50S ribosomal protein L21 [Candidatus Woesebacteria bacterium]
MKYAVIALSGSQFKVTENQKLSTNNLNLKEGNKSSTNQVLLVADDKNIKVGTPIVKGATVDFTVLKNYKGKKVRVFRYKAKSRYRKTKGFRPQLTEIQISKINF